MASQVPPELPCPTCKKRGPWFETPYGPFCSKRCRLIDLGKWLGEEHRVSEPLRPEHFTPYGDLPPGDYLDDPDAER
jgi:endogenous inhibitor of DNA gyrase (YacG/DUF329 family)